MRIPKNLKLKSKKTALIFSCVFLFVYSINLFTIFLFSYSKLPSGKPESNVIIFGAKPYSTSMRMRTTYGIDVFTNYGGKIIFSGGQTESRFAPEAEIMKELALTYGFTDKVILESHSKNSYENLINTRELISHSTETNIFISDCFHLARLVTTAKILGYKNIFYSCPNQSYYNSKQLAFYYFRESIALPWYIITTPWR